MFRRRFNRNLITVGINSYEKWKIFKYLGVFFSNEKLVYEEIKCRLKAGNSSYYYWNLFEFSLKKSYHGR